MRHDIKLQNLIYKMVTENTGKAMGDSGDAYGRNWQKNKGKTLQQFLDGNEATLHITKDHEGNFEAYPTISVFHYMLQSLELDALCDAFNDLPVNDWEGSYYGVSAEGDAWLTEHGFLMINEFNTYNHDSSLSQVLQGTWGEFDGEPYVLLQVHGGCDVRGGYTDAKLFKIGDECVFNRESCSFYFGDEMSIEYYDNDMLNYEGNEMKKDEFNSICTIAGEGNFAGSIF